MIKTKYYKFLNYLHELFLSSLFKNSFWNILGLILPLAVGIYFIPKIILGVGVERFGLLSAIWVFLGYFSIFDLGLSKGMTLFISKAIHTKNLASIGPLLWTSVLASFGLSALVSAILWAASYTTFAIIFDVTPELLPEVLEAGRWALIGIPITIVTTLLKGAIEAKQDFKRLNWIQVFNGIYNYASPILVITSNQPLVSILQILILWKVIILVGHFYLLYSHFGRSLKFKWAEKSEMRQVIKFGGWLTVSNIISPIMSYFDRFFLGGFAPFSQIAYYTVPFDLLQKALGVPVSISRVAFAELSSGAAPSKATLQYRQSYGLILFFSLCIWGLIMAFGYWGLTIWIDEEFANQSILILQVLSTGLLFNSIAQMPLTLLQSQGRSDLIAKVHLFELPFYLMGLYFGIKLFGVVGAAVVWSIRVALDWLILEFLSHQFSRN